MTKTCAAIYESGVLKPLEPLDLKEHERVKIAIITQESDDLPLHLIAKVAEQGRGFTFLEDESEDIYTIEDGEKL